MSDTHSSFRERAMEPPNQVLVGRPKFLLAWGLSEG